MEILKKSFIITLALIPFSLAHANYLFAPSLSYLERNTNDNGTSSDVKLTKIDLKLGYVFDFGMYLGGVYSLSDENFGTDSSDYTLGFSAGYIRDGFFGILTYHLLGERDLAAGGIKYSGASGFQLDTGYVIPLTDNLSLGPQLSWSDVKYRDQENSGIATSANYDWSGITPYFTLWFMFK